MRKADRSHGSQSKKRALRETGSSRLWRQPGILAITRCVCSYDTDDSEYNFIPGHVNIDDIEVEDDENFSLGEEQAEPDPERMSR